MTREETLKNFKNWCQRYIGNDCSQDDYQMANNIIALLEQEPCEDCVSRSAIMKLQQAYRDASGYIVDNIVSVNLIRNLSSVTPKQRTGKWIRHDTGHSIYYDCSLCGCAAPCTETADKILWKMANYCPDCGAKMEGVSE